MMYDLNETEMAAIDQWSAIARELFKRTAGDEASDTAVAAALIQQTLQVTALRQADRDNRAAIVAMGGSAHSAEDCQCPRCK